MSGILWILSEVYYPEETGTGYYITKIAEHLAKRQTVSALCSQPAYSRAGVKASRIEIHERVHIFRCPSLILNQRTILARLMRMLSITVSMFFMGLFRIRRGDAILAVTNPPSVPMLAAVLSFILHVPYSLVVHDVYPDILAACGLTSRKAISYKVLQKISRIVLIRAQEIFCIGRDMSEHLTEVRGTGTSNGIIMIPLWSDCEEIWPSPKESNPLLKKLGLTNKFILLYAGNMGHPHGIETIAAAIKNLESDEGIHFVFIGSGPKMRILNEMVVNGSKNLTLLPPQPRSEQNEFLNACDISIMSLMPEMLGLAVPSRTYNLMAAAKPIIALVSASSEVAKALLEEKIGWVIEPGAVMQTVETIRNAKENRALVLEMGARARRVAETKYSRKVILSQFESFFQFGLPGSVDHSRDQFGMNYRRMGD
jgi:colanic acid biosynthesis glycosyl transferase WcaI